MDSGKAERKIFDQIFDLAKAEKEKQVSLKSLELLQEFVTKGKHCESEKNTGQCSSPLSNTPSYQVLPADQIMRLARALLDLLKFQNLDPISIVSHFRAEFGVPSEVTEDLELALLVQASAEKVDTGKYATARRLLSLCDDETFMDGSPVQRTVFYFARALKERIVQELEKSHSKIEGIDGNPMDVEQTLTSLKPSYIQAQQELPFSLTTRCAAVQSILDTMPTREKIHLIDFGINNGSHWTMMMQALAARSECPLELLKITAAGTSEEMMKETGNRLSSFAESLNICFSFKIVVSDLKDLKEEYFQLETNEAVVVYMAHRIWTVLAWPGQLEALLRLIKNLKPCLIIIKELELCTNSPSFVEGFNEALLFSSATFDSLNVCMEDYSVRKVNEQYLGEMIRSTIASHGSESIFRNERIDMWRALFARYDIVETELSSSALQQASLLLKSFARWKPCTLSMNGKCLILNWNETRVLSLSAWKSL